MPTDPVGAAAGAVIMRATSGARGIREVMEILRSGHHRSAKTGDLRRQDGHAHRLWRETGVRHLGAGIGTLRSLSDDHHRRRSGVLHPHHPLRWGGAGAARRPAARGVAHGRAADQLIGQRRPTGAARDATAPGAGSASGGQLARRSDARREPITEPNTGRRSDGAGEHRLRGQPGEVMSDAGPAQDLAM